MATTHPNPGPEGGSAPPSHWPTGVALALCLAGAVAAFGFYIASIDPARPPDLGGQATLLPTPRAVSDFALTDHNEAAFDRPRLLGQWTLLFFGYTYCPDVCPVTLQTLEQAKQLWDAREPGATAPPQIVFVSVDPDRDTLVRLREYLAHFGPSFIGATGTEDALADLARSIGVYFAKAESEDDDASEDDYQVDHSAQLYLVDPQARLRAVLVDPHDPAEFARIVTTIQEMGDEQ